MDVTAEQDRSTSAGRSGTASSLISTFFGTGFAVVGCAIALVPTLRVLGGGPPRSLRLAWDAAHGAFSIGLDPLGAFFLLPVLVLSAFSAVYGGNYLLAYRGR